MGLSFRKETQGLHQHSLELRPVQLGTVKLPWLYHRTNPRVMKKLRLGPLGLVSPSERTGESRVHLTPA